MIEEKIMFMCENCKKLFYDGEQTTRIETHGEPMYVCPDCGGNYYEIDACELCRDYPVEEYDEDGKLMHYGLCNDCFEKGIREHFMEYLNTLDEYEQEDFYCGDVDGGYVFDKQDIYELIKEVYEDNIKSGKTDIEKELPYWRQFIKDGDSEYFVEWLIKLNKKASK